MLKIEYWIIAVLIAILALAGVRPASGGATHRVIIENGADGFHNVKSFYRTGETVDINFDLLATDMDYTFTVDGQSFSPYFESDRGFVFRFTMPDHDVVIDYSMRSSMVWMPPIDKDTVLFDYYEATVATVGGDEYREWVLYPCEYEDEWIGIIEYSKFGDAPETASLPVIVPASVLDELMEVADRYHMADWEEMDGLGLTGKYYVVSYLTEEGDVRATSENMPENGREAFDACREILTRAVSEGTVP